MFIFKQEIKNTEKPVTPKELKDLIQGEIDNRLSTLLSSDANAERNRGVLQTLYDVQKLLERVW